MTGDPWGSVIEFMAPAAVDRMERYYLDPVAFAHDCIKWPEGKELREYQDEVLAALIEHLRVCVRSLHGVGKTTTSAVAILWFALTSEAACQQGRIRDWKCPTTAGAWRQLEQYLWPEVHKWAALLDWDKLGRKPFKRNELLRNNLNLAHGQAFAFASDVPANIEGVHADRLFYDFDESKSISHLIFDAAEGAFSTAAAEEGTEAYALATSTPGEPLGRFYEIQSQKPGYEDWHPIHVSLPRALTAKAVPLDWVERRKAQWGDTSAIFANRVLGEFHSADEDGTIPLSWVEAAVERWETSAQYDKKTNLLLPPERALDAVGTDVARSGEDKTILALRYGLRIHELRDYFHQDTMATSGNVVGILDANPSAYAMIDTDGLGAGVTDRVREQEYDARAFHAGAKSDKRDRSGELGFVNVRAAAWWNLREKLDPAYGPGVELPNDPELIGDLTAPHWKVASNGRIQIESKEEIKKRLGRSTDRGDAVVQAFWEDRERRRARSVYHPLDRRPNRDVAVA